MWVDLPPDQLAHFAPAVAEPADFDAFWQRQLAAVDAHPLDVQRSQVDAGLSTVEVFDLRFPGFGGSPVAAWLLLPAQRQGRLPAVVEFASYGGGRGLPHDRLVWSAAGYAHLVMDNRGQGSSSTAGVTADPQDRGAPAAPGFLTRGVLDPEQAYLTRLFVDAARAVAVARALEEVDPTRIATAGVSQGGGLALAAAHLDGDTQAVLAAVPFLAHIRRAVDITDEEPYAEVASYCTTHPDQLTQVFHTLSYLDVVNHARRITAPTLLATALADAVCPPSTVYAVANHHGGQVRMLAYPFDDHDGGGSHRVREELAFAAQHLR